MSFRQLIYISTSYRKMQEDFSFFFDLAGSIMYLQGADLRKEALCPVIFIQRKGEQRHEGNRFPQVLFQG